MVVIKLGKIFPLLRLINPRIVERRGDTAVEGCLSIPGCNGESSAAPKWRSVSGRMGRKKPCALPVSTRAGGFMSWTIPGGAVYRQGHPVCTEED